MKKLLILLIILICLPIAYIGAHRIIYSSDYKRINVLNAEIYKLKTDLVDYQMKSDAATAEAKAAAGSITWEPVGLTYAEIRLSILTKAKVKYNKDKIELDYLKTKIKIIP